MWKQLVPAILVLGVVIGLVVWKASRDVARRETATRRQPRGDRGCVDALRDALIRLTTNLASTIRAGLYYPEARAILLA